MTNAEHYTMLVNQYMAMAQTYREMAIYATSHSQQAEYSRKQQNALLMASEYEKKAREALYEIPRNR